jgi:hypothetical protein
MERKRFLLFALVACIFPLQFISAQKEQHVDRIKVIISDDHGTKFVVDTTLYGKNDGIDSMMLKNGKVIFIGKNPDDENIITVPGSNSIYIKSRNVREITVIKADTIETPETLKNKESKIYVISSAKDNGPGEHYEIIKRSDAKGEGSVKKYIYINDGDKFSWTDNGKTEVGTDEMDSDLDTNVPKYVIAKNGIVVSVEGKDEEKVKELIDDINKKLDSFKSESSTSGTGKDSGSNLNKKR